MSGKFVLKRHFVVTVAVVAAVILCFNVAAFFQADYIQKGFRNEMRKGITADTAHVANAILVNVDSQIEDLRSIAMALSSVNISENSEVDALFQRFIHIGNFSRLVLLRSDGTHTPDSEGESPLQDATQRGKFETAMSGRFTFNVITLEGKSLFEIYIPVYVDNKTVCVVRGDVNVSDVILGADTFLNNSDGYILSGNGRIVAVISDGVLNITSGNFNEWANDTVLADKIGDALILGGTHGTYTLSRGGAEYIVEYASLTSVEWALVTVTNANALSTDMNAVSALAGGGAIAFAGIVSVFVIAAGVYFYRTREAISAVTLKYDMLANADPVTGGYTLTKFFDEARKILDSSASSKYAVVSVDINKFRAINDFLGHVGGNELLARIARILVHCASDFDIITRANADSFYMLVHHNSESELERLVYSIINEVEFQITEFRLLLSFGVYYIHDRTADIRVMLDRADLARRSAKKNKNKSSFAFFDTKMVLQIREEKQIEDAMDKALESGDFKVYLQPKFDLRVPTLVTGAEALVRWQHGDELISPGRFIPLFERNGFVKQLDRFMFEEVCKQQKKWINNGFDLCVISVNMSRVHLSDPNFVKSLVEICEKYNVPTKFLEIEITESVAFENLEVLVATFAKLKFHGFNVSIDDFGTGYSSLNMLKDLKADVIKIDRAFLAGATKPSDRASAIISHVISLAVSLKMKTICEGIETLNQAKLLSSLGCNMAQGFYFARPMPIPEFERRVFGVKYYTP